MFDIRAMSIFAKILANENITVIEDKKARMAMFDVENRVLVLPKWQIPEYVQKMLVAHEVSHALHTPLKEWVDAIEKKDKKYQNTYQSILNVVEDVRIDRLIMIKYPGLKTHYINSYNWILNNKIKKINGDEFKFFDDLESKNFLNRLNSHLKINVSGRQNVDIKFSQDEDILKTEAIAVEAFADVVNVADKIFDMMKDDIENNPEIIDMMTAILDAIKKDQDIDFDKIDSSKISDDLKKAMADQVKHIKVQIKEQMQKEQEQDEQNSNAKKEPVKEHNNLFIVKRVKTEDVIEKTQRDYYNSTGNLPDKAAANFMRACFNRHKQARNLKSVAHQDNGALDMTRLHNYKISNRVFEKDKIVNRQKNHGVIVLIDGSSSMGNIMQYVTEQVYNLYLFCSLERIPFVSYVFLESHSGSFNGQNINGHEGGYKLHEFFKDRKYVNYDYTKMQNIARGGTPLCSSLISLCSIAEKFKIDNKIDVMSVIVITDGECDSVGKTYETYKFENTSIHVNTEISPLGKKDSSAALFKIISDVSNANVLTFNLNHDSDNSILKNQSGVKCHFNIPVENLKIDSNPESRVFLKKLIEEIASND